MNILVVDDKKAVQDMLIDLLISQGHIVDKAVNGLDALGKAQQGNYQLFVIDHLMPLMNGLQLTKNLKKIPEFAETKIIFMTTQGIDSLKNLPEYSLFDKTIDKPINKDKFLAVLSELTDSSFECEPLQVNS
ncbi:MULTISPECIES: response regulator [Colwellia]|uniref:Response regulator n=1 Tax=Colwellia marinimaniae TaxID=1513592 RepID=A0ABQ0MSU3_9GAMM|nr:MULTISPECIES: response regulator [Colwellia]GAW95443.1 response regulator [Colwellia marinimaniae]